MVLAKTKRKVHHWTSEEEMIVRRDYKGTDKSAELIAAKLGVSFHAVKNKAQQLGINPVLGRWTRHEEEMLEDMAGKYSPNVIAQKMRRSPNAIVVRMKRLHLSRARDGWYTKKDACVILGVDDHWIQRRIDDGKLKATYHIPGCKPKQRCGYMWHITKDDLKDFIRRYPEELTGRNLDVVQFVEVLAGVR
jgi:hypothetical protein